MIMNYETYTEGYLPPKGYAPHTVHFLAGSPYEICPLILCSFQMTTSETELEFLSRIGRALCTMQPNLDPKPPNPPSAEDEWFSVTQSALDELNAAWTAQQDDSAQLATWEQRVNQLEKQLSETEEASYGLQNQLSTAHLKTVELHGELDNHTVCNVTWVHSKS